jgi:hypothetical protein
MLIDLCNPLPLFVHFSEISIPVVLRYNNQFAIFANAIWKGHSGLIRGLAFLYKFTVSRTSPYSCHAGNPPDSEGKSQPKIRYASISSSSAAIARE